MVDKTENDFDDDLENMDDDSTDYEDKSSSLSANKAEARRRIEDLKDQKKLNELLSEDDYWDF